MSAVASLFAGFMRKCGSLRMCAGVATDYLLLRILISPSLFSTTAQLAERFNITMKAVRDVWNLRTWTWTTMPYWSRKDHAIFLKKHLCAQCRRRDVKLLEDACRLCSTRPQRGRRATRAISSSAGGGARNEPIKDTLEMHAADVWELVTQGLPEAPADSTDLSWHLVS